MERGILRKRHSNREREVRSIVVGSMDTENGAYFELPRKV